MPDEPSPAAPPASAPSRARRWRRGALVVSAALLLALATGAAGGLAARRDLPSVRDLETWRPAAVGRIYGADENVIAMLGDEKRILITTADLPKVLKKAIVAVEDQNFWTHPGVDPMGVARAVFGSIRGGRIGAEGGASTITMQLAGTLFLDRSEKSASRKLQEAMLALEIERTYSKEEILTFYCNQIYLAPRRYGVEAASQYYFGKPVRELNLQEAALLAGIVQNPGRHNPFNHPDSARERRRHVLERMVEEKMISPAEAAAAGRAPLPDVPHGEDSGGGSYFVEVVRRDLYARYGEAAVTTSGMKVRTTLDPVLQRIAGDALRAGLLEVQGRRGWTGAFPNIAAERKRQGLSIELWTGHAGWAIPPAEGSLATALVTRVDSTRAWLRLGDERAELVRADMGWSGRSSPASVLRPGDLLSVRVGGRDEASGRLRLAVEPRPEVEGAVVAIDPATGAVSALVGGFDFERSQFDRATQSLRQPGSSIKPIVAATALSQGLTASERVLDIPTVFTWRGMPAPYQPENSHRNYSGLVTLRGLLEESRNIATVRLLARTGVAPVIEQARSQGITSNLQAFPSLALGAFEVSLMQLTSAYGAFANGGVWVEPHLLLRVEEADGRALDTIKPKSRQALSPANAYLVTHLLRGVIDSGTARSARRLLGDFAGKTGTTNDHTDAWFVGYSPSLVVGVWVGLDRKEQIGRGEDGAQAALPIWMEIMEKATASRPAGEFPKPPGVSFVDVDRRTGLRATPESGCAVDDVMQEAYAEGNEPAEECSPAGHARLAMPYFLQEFPANAAGELRPRGEGIERLAYWLRRDPQTLKLGAEARAIEVTTPEGTRLIALDLDADGRRLLQAALAATPLVDDGLPTDPAASPDPRNARGLDGRPVDIVAFP